MPRRTCGFKGIETFHLGTLLSCILSDNLVDMIENPSRGGQEAFVVRFRGYIWVVPFVVEKDDSIFLKTAYPSRKMNARFGGSHEAKDQS